MDKIQAILLKRHEKIETAYQHFRNNPFDPDKTHALRVSVRKFRALLNVMKPIILTETYDQINHDLRQIAQVFEAVRELDVLIEQCAKFAVEQPKLSEAYDELFDYLIKERRKEMRRTLNKTNTQHIQDTLTAVHELIDQLPEHLVEGERDRKEGWSDYVSKRIKKKDKELRKAYGKVDSSHYESIHETRLMAKKLRYAVKYLDELTDLKTKPMMKCATRIQNEFGEITDLHVNLALLEQYATKAEKPAVQQLLTAIRENKITQLNTLADENK